MEFSQAFFLYIALIKIADVLTVLGVWALVWFLRFQSQFLPISKGIPSSELYLKVTIPLVFAFATAFHLVGAYRKERIPFGFRSIKKVTQGAIVGSLVFVSILYFMGETHVSRIYIAAFTTMACIGLGVERLLLHGVWKTAEKYWIKKIQVLLVGYGPLLEMFIKKIESRKPYPFRWIAHLKNHSLAELENELRTKRIDHVVVSYPTEESNSYAPILERLSNELLTVKVLPDFGKYSTFSYSGDEECGIPLLRFNQPPVGSTDRFLKRFADLLGSFFFLLLFSPLFILISILVKLTSRGPIFYSQIRIGADGKLFRMYKFRSMTVDAEQATGAVWAKKDDTRTTWLGAILRKTSLDEIPQFYNVLRGDMSLVGPRPERPVFVDQFRKEIPKYMLRHKMKSGITGWAQINGWRGNTSIDERIKHDLFYIQHWSHYFDIKIMVLTLFKGFVNKHAY